jgi:hypothetical protein
LSAQASQGDVSSVRLCRKPAGAIRGALGCVSEAATVKVVDTNSDTTQSATPRNGGQPSAKI